MSVRIGGSSGESSDKPKKEKVPKEKKVKEPKSKAKNEEQRVTEEVVKAKREGKIDSDTVIIKHKKHWSDIMVSFAKVGLIIVIGLGIYWLVMNWQTIVDYIGTLIPEFPTP